MKQTTIPVKPDARIVIKCSDDLSIEGTDAVTLTVIVDQGDSLRMKEENGVFRIASDSDCRVILPNTVTVTVEKVGGDAILHNLVSRLVIGKIGGDLRLQSFGGASIESVGDDCSLRGALGAVEINRIGSTLTADGVKDLLAGSVGDDARISNFDGKLDVNAGDEITLRFPGNNLPEIHAKAGSDIRLIVPAVVNGQLEIQSGGEEIHIHAGGQEVETQKGSFSLPLGNGGELVNLMAGDTVTVTDTTSTDWDFEDESDNLQDHWKDFGLHIEENVREGLRLAADSMQRASQSAEFAGRAAQEKIERAMRHMEERGFGSGRPRKVVGFTMDEPGSSAPKARSGPTDEERMLVLKMLQEKKISVEEAEKLLNALDR